MTDKLLEIVSPEFLAETFNGDAFNQGLAKVVETTRKTGYEAIFGAAKKLGENRLIYTPDIVIGNSCSVNREIALERAKQSYKRVFGEKPQLHTFKGKKSFRNFCHFWGEDLEKPFPHLDEQNSWESEIEHGNIQDFYALFDVHTHPSGPVTPSVKDLESLNLLRHSYQGIEQVFPRTISVIVGVKRGESQRYIPVSFTQERADLPLDEKDLISGKTELDFKKKQLSGSLVLQRIFGIAKNDFLETNKEDLYNFGFAWFDRETGKMDFKIRAPEYPMKFEDFAFECRDSYDETKIKAIEVIQ